MERNASEKEDNPRKPRSLIKTLTILLLPPLILSAGIFWLVKFGSNPRMMPVCLLHELTGLYCLGCGSGRMMVRLLHGDFLHAFQANPLVFLMLPVISGIAIRCWMNFIRNRKTFWPGITISLGRWIFILLIVYGILRNLSFFPFILLAPK